MRTLRGTEGLLPYGLSVKNRVTALASIRSQKKKPSRICFEGQLCDLYHFGRWKLLESGAAHPEVVGELVRETAVSLLSGPQPSQT